MLADSLTITTINIGSQNIGAEGGKALADTLVTITTIDINYNTIGNEGTKALAYTRKVLVIFPITNITISTINLHLNNVDNDGATILKKAITIINTKNLPYNKIDA